MRISHSFVAKAMTDGLFCIIEVKIVKEAIWLQKGRSRQEVL
jgi:hypothetical protein